METRGAEDQHPFLLPILLLKQAPMVAKNPYSPSDTRRPRGD
jgi:hypothetical protein